MRYATALAACSALVLVAPRVAAQQWGEQERPPEQGDELRAGGLAPPKSQPPADAPPPSPVEQELERADREDAGRGLEFFWINGDVGFEVVGLQTLRASQLVDTDVVETVQMGPVFGGGLGLRLVYYTAGARFRYGAFQAWDLWTLDAEAGIRIPLGSLEPYAGISAGYASIATLQTEPATDAAGDPIERAAIGISGWNVRTGGGIDWYLSSAFSLGANLSADLLFLRRPKLERPSSLEQPDVYAADGSSIGSAVTVAAVVGLHF